MATIKDVAREAGLSVGTVSNVLNNAAPVSAEKRQRVLAAVEKLQYHPNMMARSLKTRVSHSIGLVIPDITNPYYPEISRAVEDRARESMYSVFLCNTDRNADQEKAAINSLIEKKVDGIILTKSRLNREEVLSVCQECAVVLVDTLLEPSDRFGVVNIDGSESIREALEILYQYGHRRIAYIGGSGSFASDQKRYMIYQQYMDQLGLPGNCRLVVWGEYNWQRGYDQMKALMEQENRPTAVFCANDILAIGALKAAHDLKLKVPEDLSIVGYDGIDIVRFTTPALTTVAAPKYEIGRVAVELILSQIVRSRARRAGEAVLKTHLEVRESIGPCPHNA